MVWHYILFGLLLGWGAAIPIGPMNLEIIRRNLTLGTRFGVAFGAGAASADITYIILLSLGLLVLLQNPTSMTIITLVGSCILLYFGYKALTAKVNTRTQTTPLVANKIPKHYASGYFLTLLNPYTIIFWLSVSTQITGFASTGKLAVFWSGLGVFLAALSWALSLNTILHFTKHKIPENIIKLLNKLGAIILFCFAGVGFYRVLFE